MALGINTNVASINAQNQLSKSQGQNDQALERLSSGLRINSAKDDAAGLAISTRFESQINGLNVASRNSNDGISLAQTAEGALDEITNNLQRVRDLSVQAANATNSSSDRQALDSEVQQRLDEVERIASETSFNGLNVLDGSFGTAEFQVGANAGQTIGVDLNQGAGSSQIGQIAQDTGNAVSGSIGEGDIGIAIGGGESVNIKASSNFADGTAKEADTAFATAEAIRASGVQGLSVEASNEYTFASADVNAEAVGSSADGDSYTLEINGETVVNTDFSDGNLSASDIADRINAKSDDTGVTASFDAASGDFTLNADDGRDIQVTETASDGATTNETATGLFGATDGNDETVDQAGTLKLSSSEEIEITGSNVGNLGFGGDPVTITKDNTTLDSVSVTDVDNANDSIRRIDSALSTVNDIRGDLGAVQNRFESTIANLDNNVQNLEAANSRIKDADFAAESAKLSQSQVLQQAGISVLSQANQRPQQVLSLLQ